MDGDLPRPNGQASGQLSNSNASRESSNAPSVAQPETDLSPLARDLRDASEKLSDIQKAIKAITVSCIQHADDITQIPEFRRKYEDLKKEADDKDAMITSQENALEFLGKRASNKEKAIAEEAEKNSVERERLKQEKIKLDQKSITNSEALERKKLELKAEATKALSRQAEKQNEEFEALKKGLEIDVEKRKKELNDQVGNLKSRLKKDQETIRDLRAQADKLRLELKDENERREDIEQAKGGYKRKKEQLEEELKDLQEEFSLNSKPLEY